MHRVTRGSSFSSGAFVANFRVIFDATLHNLVSLKKEAPAHYSEANIIRKLGQQVEVRIPDPVDFMPSNFIIDNWEAAKSSGTLELMSQDQLVSFIEFYSTLSRNFGATQDDYTIYIRRHADDIDFLELNRISRNVESALNVKKSLLNSLKCFEEIKDFKVE